MSKKIFAVVYLCYTHCVIGHIPIPQPYFIDSSLSVDLVEHSTVWLPCSVGNLGESVIRWWRGRILLADSSDHTHPRPPRMRMWANNTLEIAEVKRDDVGVYMCQVVRKEPWRPLQLSHHLNVLYQPEIFTEPETGFVDVKLGETVEIACLAKGAPTPNVTWNVQGQQLPIQKEKQHILIIPANSPKVAQTYQCIADNGVGEPATAEIRVSVRYKPHIQTESNWVHVALGLHAELSCKVSAEPQATVEWFYEGAAVDLKSTPRVSMHAHGQRNTLHFKNITEADLGTYTCRATNTEGTSEAAIELSGQAKAAHLKAQSISQWNDSINIVWEVDSYTPIIEYSLRFREITAPDDSEWVTVIVPADGHNPGPIHSKSYVLSGLQMAARYEVVVCSRNRYGWSAPSAPFLFATEGAELPIPDEGEVATTVNEGTEPEEFDLETIDVNTIAKELSISNNAEISSTTVHSLLIGFIILRLHGNFLNNTT